MAKTHKDVEYVVSGPSGKEYTFKDPDDAFISVCTACIYGGKATLDVLVYSKGGAKAYMGDAGIEQYEEDPDASVFERLEFKCNSVGRVP